MMPRDAKRPVFPAVFPEKAPVSVPRKDPRRIFPENPTRECLPASKRHNKKRKKRPLSRVGVTG
jgi:hypothetical protein